MGARREVSAGHGRNVRAGGPVGGGPSWAASRGQHEIMVSESPEVLCSILPSHTIPWGSGPQDSGCPSPSCWAKGGKSDAWTVGCWSRVTAGMESWLLPRAWGRAPGVCKGGFHLELSRCSCGRLTLLHISPGPWQLGLLSERGLGPPCQPPTNLEHRLRRHRVTGAPKECTAGNEACVASLR